MIRAAATVLLALAAAPAFASSPAAWAEERHRAEAACRGEAGLTGAQATPLAGFDDRRGLDAMLLTGLLHRGPPLKVTMLCLYDRRARTATAIEARGWPAVRAR